MKPSSLTLLGLAALLHTSLTPANAKSPHSIELTFAGTVAHGAYLQSAAEIAAYDPVTKRVFVVNAQKAQIDVVDIADPAHPAIVASIVVEDWGAVANSVSIHDGVVAVAVEAAPKTDPGHVVFFGTDLQFLSSVQVGSLPDMLTFTPNGRYVLVANEGEPNTTYTVDPEGTVSIIDLAGGVSLLTQANVRTAGFGAFPKASLPPTVRIYGPGATVAQDMEPEFITVSHDSKTAWVTLQENNAIAILDIATARVTSIAGLGTKDHSAAGNALDASDRDGIPVANSGRINIRNWPVKGFYLPDGIASYKVGTQTFLVVANEGDTRDWDAYKEEIRIADMKLDPTAFPNAADLQKTGNLGRLRATNAQGFQLNTLGEKVFSEIFTFGGRSFSIRAVDGTLVWDSGDQFERITAAAEPTFFNVSNDANAFDARSSSKGPEPEGVAIGKIGGRTYAFIGLERIGGIMVYDITVPTAPVFIQWANRRDYAVPTTQAASGDLGPEGLLFIAGEDSPNGRPLLVVSNEVSGTTTVYEISRNE